MEVNEVPKLDMSTAETGCCPKFEPNKWDKKTFVFKDKLFVRATNRNFWHMPLGIGKMMTATYDSIKEAGAETDDFVLLSTDTSPWKGEHYFAVSKEVPGQENVKLSGTFEAVVFEGSYSNVRKWIKQLQNYIADKDEKLETMYFYYTTCPGCAKHYGKNYVVGIAQVT